MAKRKQTLSLDTLASELRNLDARRKTLINQLSSAIRSLAGGEALLMPWAPSRRGRPAGRIALKRKGARKRKMSAAARKKISEAQRKRWAAQKAGKK